MEYAITSAGLSVPTGMAIETYFRSNVYDDQRVIPTPRYPLQHYNSIWINLRTLIRNLFNAIGSKNFLFVPVEEYLDYLAAEITVLRQLFSGQTVTVYMSLYQSIYNTASIKDRVIHPSTAKDKAVSTLTTLLLREVMAIDSSIRVMPGVVHGTPVETALILTHIPYDLLGYKQFKHLTLLESHTGVTKEPMDFSTKFMRIRNEPVTNIPFTTRFLIYFGDGRMFKPFPIRWREEILRMAMQYGWTQATTHTKIAHDLQKHPELLGAQAYLDLNVSGLI